MRAALAFLTVLPVERSGAPPRRAALLAFPLAGLLVGGACALLAWGGSTLWSPLVGAALAVALDLALTGALHVDAVADVADGLASRRPAEQAKAIMREPQVGAVGAAAAALALLLRLAWVATLAAHGLWLLLAAAPALGRAAMVLALALGDTPEEGSLARGVARDATPAAAAAALVLAGALALALGALASGRAGLYAGAAATAATALLVPALIVLWRRRFGALTGDATGAIGLVAELAALALLALSPQL